MSIDRIDHELAELAEEQFARIGWRKPAGYFRDLLARQEAGELVALVAHEPGRYFGHVRLMWETDHPSFRAAGIPEIQDLNVLPEVRRQGIGSALIARCEALAADRATTIGIGVGLHPGYNAAQRLYARLGYLLDGHGVTYAGEAVEMGRSYPFDDQLTIHFTKRLDRAEPPGS